MRPSHPYRDLAYKTFKPAEIKDAEGEEFLAKCEEAIAKAGHSVFDDDDVLEYVYAATEMWEIYTNGFVYCHERNPKKITDRNPQGFDYVLYTEMSHPGFQDPEGRPDLFAGGALSTWQAEGSDGLDGDTKTATGNTSTIPSADGDFLSSSLVNVMFGGSLSSAPTSPERLEIEPQPELYRNLAYKHFHPQLIVDIEDDANVMRVCQSVLEDAGYPHSTEDDFLEFIFAATEMWEIAKYGHTYRKERNPEKIRDNNPSGWDHVAYTRENHPAFNDETYRDPEMEPAFAL